MKYRNVLEMKKEETGEKERMRERERERERKEKVLARGIFERWRA